MSPKRLTLLLCHCPCAIPSYMTFEKRPWHEVKVLGISIGFQILRAQTKDNDSPTWTSTSQTETKCKFTCFWNRPFFKRFNGILGISPVKKRVLTRLWIFQKVQQFFASNFQQNSSTDPPAFKQWFFVGTSNFMGLSRGSNVGSGCVVLLHVFLMMTGGVFNGGTWHGPQRLPKPEL